MRSDTFDHKTQSFDFSHVPKCGGTTVHHFLKQLMDDRYVHCSPDSGWREHMRQAWGAGGHQLRGQNPISQRKRKEIVRLIILREPLQRFLSFHRHVNDHPGHYLAQVPGLRGASVLDFARYCEANKVKEFFNLQSRYVVGVRGDKDDLGEVLEKFTEFDFFAPLEMLPWLRVELSRFFQKEPPALVAQNVSKPSALMPADIAAAAEIVYKHNFNDLQLFHACNKRLMDVLLARGSDAHEQLKP